MRKARRSRYSFKQNHKIISNFTKGLKEEKEKEQEVELVKIKEETPTYKQNKDEMKPVF